MRPSRRLRPAVAAAALLAAALLPGAAAAQTFLGPTPYLRASDSPFSGTAFSYFHRDTYEGEVRAPGATPSAGLRLGPSPSTDSVDEDDGAVDGAGTAGHSWYLGTTRTLTIDFSAAVLGALPTHAGLVWTDVGLVGNGLPIGFDGVTFRAFGVGLAPLGAIGPFALGDGAFAGETAEDRFFGVIFAGGIERIEITMTGSSDWEVDHLQFGRARSETVIPEPATALLLGAPLGLLALAARRRRAR